MTEVMGSYRKVQFEVSTNAVPGAFSVDDRVARSLGSDMSSMFFRKMIEEHKLSKITFAWDLRERAREIFYCIANGYDSYIPISSPINIDMMVVKDSQVSV